MNLTVRQAAAYLHVDESTVRKWIAKRGLPSHRVNEGLRLNALELWEWATEQGVPVARSLLDQARKSPEPIPPLSALLTAGGIHHNVGGDDKAGVLRVPADGKLHDMKFEVPIERSSWVALRQFPQLHTNPVNVIVGPASTITERADRLSSLAHLIPPRKSRVWKGFSKSCQPRLNPPITVKWSLSLYSA